MSDALKDLAIVPVTSSDTNYFLRKVTGLKIDKIYSFKFQWVLEDDTLSDWSPGYQISTPTESVPSAPSATVPPTSTGNIPVTLSAFPANAKRVDIYVIGGAYGAGKVVDSFFAAGTKTISITEPGVYQVALITVTPSGINGTPTNTFSITVSGSSVDTTVVPGVPSSVTVTGFNEPSDPLNRTGYANISWTAGSGAKGYWVGLWTSTPGSTDPVRQIETNGTSIKVDGLFVGSSYYFKVKSYNEFNNPSAWVAPSANYPVTIPGNASVPGKVTVTGTGTPKSIVATWTVPASNADLVTAGGYYIAKIYSNSGATGSPIETKTCYSNTTTFAGLTTGSSYYITVQAYTAGTSPVAGTLSDIYGPFVPTAIEPPDISADFILANNQLQVGGTSGANDVHLSAYTKTVDGQSTKGRIYIGGPETSGSAAVGLYNSSGTPFYADNLGRFSLGDKLTWSGSALNVKGTIDVTGASTFSSYVLTGATNSAFVGIGYQVPYRLANVLKSGVDGLTGIVINSSGTVADSDYIKSDGTFRLAGGAITFTGGTLAVSGNITANSLAANTSLSGLSITGTTGTFGSVTINSSGITSTNFSIGSTGIITATAGTIGGWSINSTQLRSSFTYTSGNSTTGVASYITLDPATPGLILTKDATITSGVPTAGSSITINPVSGIVGPSVTVSGNTGPGFSFSPNGTATLRGSIYATTGVIGGWSLGSSALTGGTLTLNSSGTITSTGSVTGFTNTPINVSSTLSSGRMQTMAVENTIGYFGSDAETGFSSSNNTNKTSINPNGISIQSTSAQLGVGVGGFTIQNSSGDYAINFLITGAPDANGLTSRYIQFNHWVSSAQVTKDNVVNTFDAAQSGIRRLVIYQGILYTGETQYFSTTQTTTPSASTGQNGDLFYSTA